MSESYGDELNSPWPRHRAVHAVGVTRTAIRTPQDAQYRGGS